MPKYILEDIVGKEGENNLLNASEGTEFDSSLNKTMSTEEQKKRLNAEQYLLSSIIYRVLTEIPFKGIYQCIKIVFNFTTIDIS